MTKKTLSVLLALLLVLSLFPTAALAEEESEDALPQLEDQLPEAGPEDPETPETGGGETALTAPALETAPAEELTVYPDADLPENDELFQDYIDLYLAGVDPSEFGSSVYGVRDPVGDKLGETDKKIYTHLKTEIGKIAENGGSAVIELPLSLFFDAKYVNEAGDLALLPMSYFGVNSIMDYNSSSGNAKIKTALTHDLRQVVNALLLDCPYSLYWYDKTTAMGAIPGPGYGAYYLDGEAVPVEGNQIEIKPGREADYTVAVEGTYTLPFPVAQDYRDEDATTPATTVRSTNLYTVDEEIKKLVNATYASDYARLEAYKDYICGAVSYDNSALTAGTAYGDPWQLISVFDGDTSTNVVCEGYAKAFQYLCDRSTFENSSVECYLVSGVMRGGTGDTGGGHMWNVVRMDDGKSYLVDVTNSDKGSAGEGGELFLAGFDDSHATGALADKNLMYTVAAGGKTITFQYYDGSESGTIDQYAAYGNVLKLATANYPKPAATAKVTSVVLTPTAGTRLEIPSSKSSTNQLSFTLKVMVEGADGSSVEDPNLADSVKLTFKIDDTHTLYWPASTGQASGMLGLTLSHAQLGIVDLKSNSNLNSTELNTLMGMITNSTGKECDLTASYGGQTATVKVTLAREAQTPTTFSGNISGKKLNESTPVTLAIPLADPAASYDISFTVKDQYGTAMAAPTYNLKTAVDGVTVSGSTMTVASTAGAATATLEVKSGSVTKEYPIKLAKIEFSGLDNVTATGTYGETWRTILGRISFSGAQATLDGAKQDGTFKAALPVNTNDTDTPIANTYSLDITFDGVSTGKTATVTVAPKPITVTIANASRYYGQANPAFTATVNESQLVSGDSADSLKYTLTTAATDTSAPDTYDITGTADASSNSNYQLTFVKGTLTVKPAQMKLSLTKDNNTVSMATAEAASGNLTALGLPVKVGVTFTEDDKSTVLNIADAPTEVSVTWAVSGTLSLEQALVELKKENAPDFVDLTLTPTVNEGQTPAWARQFAEKPTFTLRVTGREVATITVENWGTDYATRTYDGTAQKAPQFKVTGKDSANLGIGDETKFTYQYELASDPGKPLSGDIKDAGTYRLVATYRDETYYGRFSQEFTISPKELTGLTWAGTTTRDYDGTASNVTATVTTENGLVTGDVVTVRVTGGTEKNAGTHTATAAGLTGADAGNYTIAEPDRTKEYTINKANRTLTVTIDHAILSPKTGLTGTLTVTVGGDDATSATVTLSLVDPAARASADVVSLDSANRRVTAVGNGTAQVTASVAATTNYNAATATPVTVTAYARPITGAITVTSSDRTAKLAAVLAETTSATIIKVSGIWAENSTLTGVTPTLCTGLTSSYAGGKLTITETAGSTVVAEYDVDTTVVTALPAGVKVEEGNTTGTVADAIPAEQKTEVNNAVTSNENKLEGAVESAASTLVNIAEVETAKPGNAGKIVTVQVDLKIEAKAVVTAPAAPADAKKASYTIDVQPVCSVYVTTDGVTTGKDPVRTENLSTGFTTPVTVTVELPAFLVTAYNTATNPAVYAKHTPTSGQVEYLPVTVGTAISGAKTATWQMSSFSDVELYVIEDKSITVSYKDASGNVTQTVTYGEANRAENLLDNKTWTIGGQQYTTVAQLLDSALTGTVDATPYTAPVTPVDPTPSRPSGGGGGGGGGGSSFGSYSISAPTTSSKHGSVSLSTTSAKKGDTVTLTPKPDAGYVLDTLVVRDSSGKQLEVKAAGDGKYTFVMPAGQVTVEATFRQEGESGGWPFADVDRDSFWAADAIAWVHEQGYMNGNSASTFNPGGTITRQQMWMILARLSGQNPASFAEARQWTMDSGVSDGTNGPNAMSRQQMVTFLYRYAQLRGYTLTGSTGIDAFPDSGLAAGYAQEPLAWAVGNGIVTGTSAGTLNPTGTATRAQFAVILQRFCENTAKD